MATFRISNFLTRISGSDQSYKLSVDVYYSSSEGWRLIFNSLFFVNEQIDQFMPFYKEVGQCSEMYLIQEAVQGYYPYGFMPTDVHVPCVLDLFEVERKNHGMHEVHEVRIEVTVPPQIK